MRVETSDRERQLVHAGELLAAARSGAPKPLVVLGEPGSGKTTMLDAIAEQAVGFRVIRIAADLTDAGVPYAPLRAGLAPLLVADAGAPRAELAAALSESFDIVAPAVSTDHPHVLNLLRRFVCAWEELGPQIICIDDLHAADPETTAAFWFLARHLRDRRIWLVATSRSDPPDVNAQQIATIGRLAEADEIDVVELAPFTDDELSRLVVGHVGHRPDETLVTLLRERTEGNPYFAVELIDTLRRSGALIETAGIVSVAPDIEPALPRVVSAAVLARIDALGADEAAVAACASIFADVSLERLPVLANLADLPGRATENAFDHLVRARILVTHDRTFRFAHRIVRDSLYDNLGPSHRRRLHDLAAKLLTESGQEGQADITEIAAHARAGAIVPDPATAALLVAAGDTVARLAPRSAVRWYRDALDVTPEGDPLLGRVQLKLSRVLGLSSCYGDAADLALAARASLPDGAERTRATELAINALRAARRVDESVGLIDAVLDDPASRSGRLAVQRAQLAIWQEHLPAARRWMEVAEEIGIDEHSRALASAVAMHLDVAAGRYQQAARVADHLRSFDDVLPAERSNVRMSLMIHAAYNDDPQLALDDLQPLASAGVMPELHLGVAAWALYRLGRWTDATRIAGESIQVSAANDQLANIFALGALIAIKAERAEYDDLQDLIDQTRGTAHNRAMADWAIALAAANRGDLGSAFDVLVDAEARNRTIGRINALPSLLSLHARLALAAGDQPRAQAVNGVLQTLPLDGRGIAATADTLIANALVNQDRASAAAARAHAERYGLAVEAATAAGVLGAIDDDVDLLLQAHKALGVLGATVRQRAVTQQLRRLGKRVSSGPRAAGELTSTENEIAGLVGLGHTNRQIAGATGLTVKTVETYMSRLFAKTGCRSRVELAVAVTTGRITIE